MYPRAKMIRTVVLLLAIACFCANVSSDEDCILEAIKRMRGIEPNNGTVEEETHTPPTALTNAPLSTVETLRGKDFNNNVVNDPQISASRNEDSMPNDLVSFQQWYLDLKQYYEKKLLKLEIENDLLKQLHSSNSNAQIRPIQAICTCNVTDRPITNDCSNLQSNICLEKVQEIDEKLSNLIKKSQDCGSSNGISSPRSVAESQDGFVDWIKLPGTAVEISAKGRELWVINSSQNIYRWNGSDWELKPGAAVRIGSSPDGWTWIVNGNDNIYRWNVNTNTWDLMPGLLVQISAMSKDIAFGVNRGHAIFLWSNNAWQHIGGAATWAGIGDGDERWVVNSAQQIFRWNHQANNWNHMPGAAVNIDVQNPCRVIMTNAMHQMFIWRNNNWQMINGTGTRSSINGTHYFTVNSAQQLFISN